jgi:hypothetical protein
MVQEPESEAVVITALHYRSAAPQLDATPRPSVDGAALQLPKPADYAARCLALGIGQGCGQLIAGMARAKWFAHLRGTTEGPSRQITRTASGPWAASLQGTPAPHVASIALPTRPSPAQIGVARVIGSELRQRGAFVIVTTASADPTLPALLGQACDCVLRGDGCMAHHSYPARTVVVPAAGRLICYDLYDVCVLWAGRLGAHGVLDPAADALHLELPSGVTTLQAADAMMTKLAANLDQPAHLRLVTTGLGEGCRKGTPVSFTGAPYIRQDRSAARHRLSRRFP